MLTKDQLNIVNYKYKTGLCVIVGPPGAGKTTIVQPLIKQKKLNDIKCITITHQLIRDNPMFSLKDYIKNTVKLGYNIIIIDELEEAINEVNILDNIKQVKKLAHELKITIILITHITEILKLANFAFYIDSDRTKMKLDTVDPDYVKYYLNLKKIVSNINKKIKIKYETL
tara:strand:- start:817 stop:1329 length:513 start_codon:yes stop_codon:yes gene_type:complete